MNLRDETLAHYMDGDGQVSIDKCPSPRSTLNGLLHTGIFYTLLAKHNQLTPADRDHFTKVVVMCQREIGLYWRRPGVENDESHDDYIGIAAASFHFQTAHRFHILSHGEANGWRFDVNQPTAPRIQFWHDRFFGLVGFYQACCGDLGFIRSLGINSALRGSIPTLSSDATDVIQKWLWVSVLDKAGILPIACDLWGAGLENCGGIQYFFAQYFGAEHPFSKL